MRTLGLVLALTFAGACSGDSKDTDDTGPATGDDDDDVTGDDDDDTTGPDGSALFATNCASCHGADGSGGVAPDPMSDYVTGRDQAALVDIITNGNGFGMPAFPALGTDESNAIAAWLLVEFGS